MVEPSSPDSSEGAKRLTFQCGLVREQVELRTMDMETLFDQALHFLERHYLEHINQYLDLHNHILLMRHRGDAIEGETVERLADVSDLRSGDVIEIVLSSFTRESSNILPHILSVHTYKSPAFCDFCGEFLWGLIRQGLKCHGCGGNYHKRCAYKIPNNCSRQREKKLRRLSIASSSSTLLSSHSSLQEIISMPQSSPQPRQGSVYTCRPIVIDLALREAGKGKVAVPHCFAIHTYKTLTLCMLCKKLLWGAIRQGKQCRDCKYNVHEKCERYVPRDCEAPYIRRITEGTEDPDGMPNPSYGESKSAVRDQPNSDSDEEEHTPTPSQNGVDHVGSDASSETGLETDRESVASIGPVQLTNAPNIPLIRLFQSVRNTKRYAAKVLKEGYMTHFTKADTKRKSHWWRLTTKSLCLYKKNDGPKLMEIPLREILSVDFAGAAQAERQPPNWTPHCFTIRMAHELIYCGENSGGNSPVQVASSPNEAGLWCEAINNAIVPLKEAQAKEVKNAKAPSSEAKIDDKVDGAEKEKPKPKVGELYQIYSDEVLGSGQFGTVYAGVHRLSGNEVAVKVIDKARFPTKQETALKNEAAILKNVTHPGIVILADMFETPDKVFVVMEKMRNDMLEMILNSQKGRLSERVTKFLIAQIVSALKYLHSKNIVHCDLKPENVLLASESDMPQVKICDFGFARIIHDHSFRNSVVGTPAYLAPEVLTNKPYNRSLDMWAVGVIIYVSLSGTFPFNEDEEISDQIQNAAFMFPPNPWAGISREAIDLVKRLLRVEQRRRFNVARCMHHLWFQTRQCWEDLHGLEMQVGVRYLTEPEEEAYWTSNNSGSVDNTEKLPKVSAEEAMRKKRQEKMEGMKAFATIDSVAPTPPRAECNDRHAAEIERRLSQLGFPVTPI